MNTHEIIVGGVMVTVPVGYLKAETEYTKDESTIFDSLPLGRAKEVARTNALAKRVEFYEMYISGKATMFLANHTPPPVKKNFWRALREYIRN